MNRRQMGKALWAGFALAATAATGCSSTDAPAEQAGTLSVPLVTQGPSGMTYRLRDAVFEIRHEYYYYDSPSVGGEGGSGTSPSVITLSSETDPDATSLSVNLERGYYYVSLRPGWRMEKVEGGVATEVEATLLSSSTQWTYVAARSTSWLTYQFGLGGRAVWFNGNLNLDIEVYEKPSDLYGGGGEGGYPTGFGGSP